MPRMEFYQPGPSECAPHVRAARSTMVRFHLHGKLHSSPAALDRVWEEEVRRRSVWVLSPAGFAYRRHSVDYEMVNSIGCSLHTVAPEFS